MKKLVLILLILILPATVQTAYYRFDPTEPYNFNNEETAADTVYLKWWYDGDSSDTHVLTTPLGGTVSTYQFDSTVAEAGDYRISMQFVDNSASVRWTYIFMFTAFDTLADTNQFTVEDIGDTVRAILNDSIPALLDSLLLKARHAQVDSLKDTVEDMSSRLLATGFAIHSQVDSLKDTTEDMSTRLLATGFSTHSQVDSLKDTVEDMSSRLLATGFATHSQVDSLKDTVEDMSTRLLATGFSTFDHTTDKVTLVDSSADGIHDAEIAALDGLDSANVIHQKLFFQGLSDSSGAGFEAVIGDSLYSERMDSLVSLLIDVKGRVLDLVYYWGACDDCYYRLFPEGGSANKDSAIIIDPSLGADSLVGKVLWLHGTAPTIVDTAFFYRDDPW